MKHLSDSELIINPNGSIYHLQLKPGELAPTIFTVGDPQRVSKVSDYFDRVDLVRQNREFLIHTGTLRGNRISVMSTGMGTDNIDIVWNEIDALFNVDFNTRTIKKDIQAVRWIRLGTSGSIQAEIPVGELVYTKKALGLEGLMAFYEAEQDEEIEAWRSELIKIVPGIPVSLSACDKALEQLVSDSFMPGYTATFGGFYAPQGRAIRGKSKYPDIMNSLATLRVNGQALSNMEMETSGIYGLAKHLGHQAISLNAIIANRATGDFSSDSQEIIDNMIRKALDAVVPG